MARWGMVIDLDKCVGCQACTVACWEENNIPHGSAEDQGRRREFHWNKVISVSRGQYPNCSIELIPTPCMHCDQAPCVTVCPVKATYRRPDGIVVQNFRRCIGCRYCMVACPYNARSFNYRDQPEEAYHRPDPPPDRESWDPWPAWRSARLKPDPLEILTTPRAPFPSCCIPEPSSGCGRNWARNQKYFISPGERAEPWKYDTRPSKGHRKDTTS